jgi:hypothetical protein
VAVAARVQRAAQVAGVEVIEGWVDGIVDAVCGGADSVGGRRVERESEAAEVGEAAAADGAVECNLGGIAARAVDGKGERLEA